jgi:hypothetical protein
MTRSFTGPIDALKARIAAAGITGKWTQQEDQHRFQGDQGGILLWWASSKALLLQGKADGKARLESALSGPLTEGEKSPMADPSLDERRIFIVSGDDHGAQNQLKSVLDTLGLGSLVIMNTRDGDRTVSNAIESYRGCNNSAHIGLVVVTPDDMGYSLAGRSEERARPRQDVVLRAGMLISLLGAGRVAILARNGVQVPHFEGAGHYRFEENVGELIPDLRKLLGALGFLVSSEQANVIADR